MKNSILSRRQKEKIYKAVSSNFVDLGSFCRSQEDVVNELLGSGIGAQLLIKIIEKRLRLPEGIYVSYVSPEYREEQVTVNKKKSTKQVLSYVIFHCKHVDMCAAGVEMKFKRSPKEIFKLISSSGIHYSMVVEERVEVTRYI